MQTDTILDQLRQSRPEFISYSNKQMTSLLNAVRHIERYPATDTTAGRPGKWKRQTLLEVARVLHSILHRETSGRVSLSSFTGLYLRVLRFPSDIARELHHGGISLQEATILARLTHQKLGVGQTKAENLRREIIANHKKVNGSQNGLRDRVRTALGEIDVVSTAVMTATVELEDELLQINPEDKRHFFYEGIRTLFYAMRDVKPDDIDEKALSELTEAADKFAGVIQAIKKKRSLKSSGRFYI